MRRHRRLGIRRLYERQTWQRSALRWLPASAATNLPKITTWSSLATHLETGTTKDAERDREEASSAHLGTFLTRLNTRNPAQPGVGPEVRMLIARNFLR